MLNEPSKETSESSTPERTANSGIRNLVLRIAVDRIKEKAAYSKNLLLTTGALLGGLLAAIELKEYFNPVEPNYASIAADARTQLMQKMGGDVGKGKLLDTVLENGGTIYGLLLGCSEIGSWDDRSQTCRSRPVFSDVTSLSPVLSATKPDWAQEETYDPPTFKEVDFVRARLVGAPLYFPAFDNVTFKFSDLRRATTDANLGKTYRIEMSDLTEADIAVWNSQLPTSSNVSGATLRIYAPSAETITEDISNISFDGLWAWADSPPRITINTVDTKPRGQIANVLKAIENFDEKPLMSFASLASTNDPESLVYIFGEIDLPQLIHKIWLCDPKYRVTENDISSRFTFSGYEPWPLYHEEGQYQPFLKYCPRISFEESAKAWPHIYSREPPVDTPQLKQKRAERMLDILLSNR
ncbi:hypothetical protein FVA81_07735 [Rhizobium sp. WL3]|uniref:hypothetical protein n=1 Tax=Rhizobium sp. WL3 TaxID=2603277 RepID=UPI0011C20191|nr:hypothetical protein [Rhizobium sp. WL3]QEE44508.1 hypothetical protein FVA81_07735 [Rhizobium sp. WL3]